MSTIALLTAAGRGTRTNQDIPKQFIHVNNKPIIIYTLEAFQRHPNIDEICVVVLKGWEDILWAYAKQFNISKLKYVVLGGETGQQSIKNGLMAIAEKCHDDNDIVIVHDGNRPMVSNEIISDSLFVYAQYGSAVAVIPCTEVVYVSESSLNARKSIPRETLWRTQTPHTYNLQELLSAHIEAERRSLSNLAASCSLMESLGKEIYFSKGSEKNLKITTTEDIEIFKALLQTHNDDWIKK